MPDTIPATEARRRLAGGARLIDIRSVDEYRRRHVPGSLNVPLESLDAATLPPGPLIFTCRSGARTAACATRIAARAGPKAAILSGGLQAWEAAGGDVAEDRAAPLEIMRQVQIAAGTLVLAGLLLGLWLHPAFLGLTAFVGAGLTFAGLSGWCGMAKLLARMPWNKASA